MFPWRWALDPHWTGPELPSRVGPARLHPCASCKPRQAGRRAGLGSTDVHPKRSHWACPLMSAQEGQGCPWKPQESTGGPRASWNQNWLWELETPHPPRPHSTSSPWCLSCPLLSSRPEDTAMMPRGAHVTLFLHCPPPRGISLSSWPRYLRGHPTGPAHLSVPGRQAQPACT